MLLLTVLLWWCCGFCFCGVWGRVSGSGDSGRGGEEAIVKAAGEGGGGGAVHKGEESAARLLRSCQICLESECSLRSGIGYILERLRGTQVPMAEVCDNLDWILNEEMPKTREKRCRKFYPSFVSVSNNDNNNNNNYNNVTVVEIIVFEEILEALAKLYNLSKDNIRSECQVTGRGFFPPPPSTPSSVASPHRIRPIYLRSCNQLTKPVISLVIVVGLLVSGIALSIKWIWARRDDRNAKAMRRLQQQGTHSRRVIRSYVYGGPTIVLVNS